MWKPGGASPRTASSSSSSRMIPTSSRAAKNSTYSMSSASRSPTSKSGGISSKRLSSGTLGMRFMQRKFEAEAAAERKRKAEEQANSTAGGVNLNEGGDVSATCIEREANEDKQLEMDDVFDLEAPSPQAKPSLIQIATGADMYGLEADIIGRRSFCGFNKPVGETWNAALQLIRNKGGEGKSVVREAELIRRYENYVQGKGRKRHSNGHVKERYDNESNREQGNIGQKRRRSR